MTEPTDWEITQLWNEQQGRYPDPIPFARAILAKFGTPPAVAGEPVAYLHDDGFWTAAKTAVGRKLSERLLFAGSPKVAVHTTPQPTQAQAGAVPLTDEQRARIVLAANTVGEAINMVEHAHGIKGGQHGAE